MSKDGHPPARIQVWQERGALHAWRWRYVVGESGNEELVLTSNDTEPSRDAAIAAALLAYPDTPIEPRTLDEDTSSARGWKIAATPIIAAAVLARIRRRRRH